MPADETAQHKKLRPDVGSVPASVHEPVFVEMTPKPEASPWEVELELSAGVVLRLRRVPC